MINKREIEKCIVFWYMLTNVPEGYGGPRTHVNTTLSDGTAVNLDTNGWRQKVLWCLARTKYISVTVPARRDHSTQLNFKWMRRKPDTQLFDRIYKEYLKVADLPMSAIQITKFIDNVTRTPSGTMKIVMTQQENTAKAVPSVREPAPVKEPEIPDTETAEEVEEVIEYYVPTPDEISPETAIEELRKRGFYAKGEIMTNKGEGMKEI